MDVKVETLETKLQRVKEENRTLRLVLETLSSKCEKLESQIQVINNAEQVSTNLKSHQSGSVLARPEFFKAQKPSQIFVKTHLKDNNLIVKDGYQWKKYGEKKVTKDNPSPRAYFKCSMAPSCPVKKRVQRSIQDKSIIVATYEGKHNHGLFHHILMPSSSTPEASMIADNLPMTNMPNNKDMMNIDLALCNWNQTDIRLCEDLKQENNLGSNNKIEECVSPIIKYPDFINSQDKELGLNLNLGPPELHL